MFIDKITKLLNTLIDNIRIINSFNKMEEEILRNPSDKMTDAQKLK